MDSSSYSLITPPASEPITITEAKAHLRVDTPDDDTLITSLIKSSRELCELYTGLGLLPQTWRLLMDKWPTVQNDEWWDGLRQGAFIPTVKKELLLERSPLVSVSTVKTFEEDGSGAIYDSSNYYVDPSGGRIVLKASSSAPTGSKSINSVEIVFSVGYADASNVPGAIKLGILDLINFHYEHRGDESIRASSIESESVHNIPVGIRNLWNPYKRRKLG